MPRCEAGQVLCRPAYGAVAGRAGVRVLVVPVAAVPRDGQRCGGGGDVGDGERRHDFLCREVHHYGITVAGGRPRVAPVLEPSRVRDGPAAGGRVGGLVMGRGGPQAVVAVQRGAGRADHDEVGRVPVEVAAAAGAGERVQARSGLRRAAQGHEGRRLRIGAAGRGGLMDGDDDVGGAARCGGEPERDALEGIAMRGVSRVKRDGSLDHERHGVAHGRVRD